MTTRGTTRKAATRRGATGSVRSTGGGGLHRPEPVAVVWDERQRRPSAFVWRGRRRRVARLVERWVVETGWWSDEARVSRSYCRVEADGRLFDLCYDRLSKVWSLERVLN